MKVEIVHLKKYFGKTKAVDDITFSFSSGDVFGFIGPNGAGKTTTMRILATIDEPTGGDAFLDGVSVVQYPEEARKRIGYVPDTLPTHKDMSVHEYLDFFARAYGIRNPRRDEVVASIEEFTNLVGIREKMMDALSKGMKQRVSLARALLHDPEVLIMDEPAAGLDPRARIELRELLKILAQQEKAILVSSHILTELEEICNGAVIIERGKILRAGTLEQIATQDVERHTVVIRPARDGDQMLKAILLFPEIENARMVDEEIEVEVRGSEDTCCDLLTKLIQQGHRIAEFKRRKADLESVFMNVTKGNVQ